MTARRPMLLFLICFAIAPLAAAADGEGGTTSPGSEAVAAPSAEEATWGERVDRVLNPAVVCPHCGYEHREERSLLMLMIGFLGQIFFTSRFLVQWIASERRKESFIPVAFWYLSIVGSLLLLAYAISIRAWPIILGQMFGVVVYSRNLVLIARKEREGALAPPAARENETDPDEPESR